MIEVFENKPLNFQPDVEVAACYLEVEGKLLLLKKEGVWSVPAGKMEKGEPPLQGAKRELFEETGIKCSLKPLGCLYIQKPHLKYIYHGFGTLLTKEPKVKLSHEHDTHTWATLKEMKQMPLIEGANEARGFYLKSRFHFTFKEVKKNQRELIHDWLKQDYVKEWLHGKGLQMTFDDLDKSFEGKAFFNHWIGYDKKTPFVYLLTSYHDKKADNVYTKHCVSEGDAISLDIIVGNTDYLGMGLAHLVIKQFLQTHFPHVSEVLIDPEKGNSRAIHVYEKAGFRIIGEFIMKHNPKPHYIMRLAL